MRARPSEHTPVKHSRAASLRRLRNLPPLLMATRLGGMAQRLHLDLRPFIQAESLLLAGQIRERPELVRMALFGGSNEREMRNDQVRARERAQIGAARGEDGVDLVGRGDVS